MRRKRDLPCAVPERLNQYDDRGLIRRLRNLFPPSGVSLDACTPRQLPMKRYLEHRREIDGLRALAVLPVVLFHAGFETFSGGFIGVDVFFVISGYLITSIIVAEKEAGTFSLVGFYERRARRILPALFLTMACCIPFAWLWLLPREMEAFSRSLVAVSLFVSNILFANEIGYFDTAAELKPLLHTWSLAVEEQYYVLFPLFMMFMWRFARHWLVVALAVVALGSLTAALWGAAKKPEAAFFLLSTRGWELAIGAFIALGRVDDRRADMSASMKQLGSVAGFGLILYSVFAYSKETPFPSVYALAPTVGAALIIVFASASTWVGRLLATRPFVGIGLISYSAYLAHQPLFAFARIKLSSEPGFLAMLALTFASFALAVISWRYVETPYRTNRKINARRVFGTAIVGSVLFFSVGIAGYQTKGFVSRFDLMTAITSNIALADGARRCFGIYDIQKSEKWLCHVGADGEQASFFVYGDSHAVALFNVFDEAARATGTAGAFTGTSGCAPFLGVHALREDQSRKNCHLLNERVFAYVRDHKIRDVYLIARWTYYTDGGYTGKNFSYLGASPDDLRDIDISRGAFLKGLKETVAAYLSIGTRVHIVSQVPQQRMDPEPIYRGALVQGKVDRGLLRDLSISLRVHKELQEFVESAFSQYPDVDRISFDELLCDDIACMVGDDHGSYYFDDDHLSIYGAELLRDRIEAVLSD